MTIGFMGLFVALLAVLGLMIEFTAYHLTLRKGKHAQ